MLNTEKSDNTSRSFSKIKTIFEKDGYVLIKEAFDPTYYVFCLRFYNEIAGISREEFLNALTTEGITIFYPGYTRPLYLLPVYQRKIVFKNGYPFSAKENQNIKTNYHLGACPNAEKLYNEEFIGSEHIRFPQTWNDMEDIIKVFNKIID